MTNQYPPPPGDNPYGAGGSDFGGGAGPGGPGYPGVPQRHPQATLTLILGIVSILCCGLVGIAAWIIGNKAVQEIDASGGAIGGRTEANIGRILGVIGIVLTVVGIAFYAIAFSIGIGTA